MLNFYTLHFRVLILLLVFTSSDAFSQCGASYCGTNVVPNADFEKTQDPQCSGSWADNQLWLDSSPLPGWVGTSCKTCNGKGITPDNFNSDCKGNSTSTCDASKGSVGFYTYATGEAREYVQAQLLSPLKPGKKYCVEMDVRNAPNTQASDGLGVYFSNKIHDMDKDNGGQAYFAFTPQVEQPKGVKISSCTKFAQTFCAKGGETCIMIGNFRTNANTTIDNGGFATMGYFIIDNVSVRELCEANPLQLSLTASPPTIICGSTSTLTLTASGGNGSYTYQWLNPANATGPGPVTVSPTVTTTYSVVVSTAGNCGDYTDTAKVVVTVDCALMVRASGSTSCDGKSASISATGTGGTPPYTFTWNPGNLTGSTHTVTPAVTTTYTVTVTDSKGDTDTGTAVVTVASKPTGSISGDTSICIGSSTILTASGGTSYQWNTSQTTASISVAPPVDTIYTVVVSASGCHDTITTHVTVKPLPTATATVVSHTISGTKLNATGGGTYNWIPSSGLSNPNSPDPIASPSETTQYCVYVIDAEGCSDSACVNVVFECDDLFIPTAFSPNADGVNDIECVLGNCFQTFLFTIYDRWGEKIFETDNSKVCWDGTYKGRLMNTAVFVYHLRATLANGTQLSKTGNISLIR